MKVNSTRKKNGQGEDIALQW